jgi:hypothetical protein
MREGKVLDLDHAASDASCPHNDMTDTQDAFFLLARGPDRILARR